MTDKLREAIAEQISEGLGATLRKFCDSPEAKQARHYLHAMPESDWNTLIGMLAEESAGAARAALAAAPQPEATHECPVCEETVTWGGPTRPYCGECAADNGRDVKMHPIAAAPQTAPEEGLTRAQVGQMLDAKRHDREALVEVIREAWQSHEAALRAVLAERDALQGQLNDLRNGWANSVKAHADALAERDAAFAAGQESMRERAALEAERGMATAPKRDGEMMQAIAEGIRDIPIKDGP